MVLTAIAYMTQHYRITLLPGDGIGPEIMAVTVEVLNMVGQQFDLTFEFQEALLGSVAIDASLDESGPGLFERKVWES